MIRLKMLQSTHIVILNKCFNRIGEDTDIAVDLAFLITFKSASMYAFYKSFLS